MNNYTCTTKAYRLYYDKGPLYKYGKFLLDGADYHHIVRVLRRREGDKIRVFHGQYGEWEADIEKIDKKLLLAKCVVLSQTHLPQNVPELEFAFAPLRSVRMDFLAQKITELGVGHVQPVLTGNTYHRKAIDLNKFFLNMKEAAEQCHGMYVPSIYEIVSFKDFLGKKKDNDYMVIFCDEALSNNQSIGESFSFLQKSFYSYKKWSVLVGPEGGFTQEERAYAKGMYNNIFFISLGPRVVRADTAAMISLSLLLLCDTSHCLP